MPEANPLNSHGRQTLEAVADLHEPDEMGAHDETDGTVWLPRSLYPKRHDARRWYLDFTGCHFLDVRILSRWMRWTPNAPWAGEHEGEFWTECERTDPGAFRVWRCE